MAVEKLAHSEFAKNGSRQEALQTIFPSLLDIFYHPIFDFFKKNGVFQQPQDFPTSIQTGGLSARIRQLIRLKRNELSLNKLPCSTPDPDSLRIESIHFMASCPEKRRRLRARYQKCDWGQ